MRSLERALLFSSSGIRLTGFDTTGIGSKHHRMPTFDRP